jgi:hypothetical protein
MTSATVVRYRTKPESAAENEQLVRDVYDQLESVQPEGFRYVTFRLEDGVSFVHVALRDDGADNPLPSLQAFERFQAGLAERVDEGPLVMSGAVVGRYGLPIGVD